MAAAMPAIYIISAVIGAGTALYSASQQAKAAQASKALAADNARLSALETEQTVRNLESEQNQQQALARARAAASGVEGASVDSYMTQLKKTGIEELDWLRAVGATRYRAALTQGDVAYAQGMGSAWTSVGQGVGSVGSAAAGGSSAGYW